MQHKTRLTLGAAVALSALSLAPLPSVAAGMGDFMNPSKWFGGGRDRDDYYRGYGYPGYGYPGYGYPPAYGWGGPPGYAYPPYGYPGYAVPAPQSQGAASAPAAPPPPQ
jgi:hypothetical protein